MEILRLARATIDTVRSTLPSSALKTGRIYYYVKISVINVCSRSDYERLFYLKNDKRQRLAMGGGIETCGACLTVRPEDTAAAQRGNAGITAAVRPSPLRQIREQLNYRANGVSKQSQDYARITYD